MSDRAQRLQGLVGAVLMQALAATARTAVVILDDCSPEASLAIDWCRAELGENAVLRASLDGVDRYAEECRSLRPPGDGDTIRDGIIVELQRARRALEMVEHGCSIQASARAGSRALEAQTAIKRGYLNVLHAREAIIRHAAEAEALRPPDPNQRSVPRRA